MAPQKHFIFLLLSVLATTVISHKLLVFSFTGSKSHMISQGRIADTLAEAGHNVTLLSFEFTIPTDEFPHTKYARVIRMGSVDPDILASMSSKKAVFLEAVFMLKSGIAHLWNAYKTYKAFTTTIPALHEKTLINEKVLIEQLRAENFDAIFVEQLFPFGTALGQALGIRTHFIVNSCPLQEHIADTIGVPLATGYVPASLDSEYSDQMTLWERAENHFLSWILSKTFLDFMDNTTDIFRKHWDPNFGDIIEYMRSSTPIIFVAVSELMDFPRPIMHNVVYIGGVGMKSSTAENASALPEPFATEMTKGENGVVFASFGSNVNTADLPDVIRRNIIDGLAAIGDSYHVILKLEKQDVQGRTYASAKPNIFVTSWAPQSQLLHHPRLKAFFTHAGYNSLVEVAQSGKPVLLMPLMYDQTRNALLVQRNGWGKMFDKTTLWTGSKQLETDLKILLEDTKFEQGAKRIQKLLATKPFSANEIFLRHVKFVLDNNGTLPELQAAASRFTFIRQFNLDLAIIFSIVSFVILSCIIGFVIFASRACYSHRNSKKKVE